MDVRNVTHVSDITGEVTKLGPLCDGKWYRLNRLPAKTASKMNASSKLPKSAKKRAKRSKMNINLTQALELKREKVNWLHEKLGHATKNCMRLVLATKSIDGLTAKDVDLLSKCNDCAHGRQRRAAHMLARI